LKVVIFCGGLGVRMGEETLMVPKPMIRIGNRPILWHIMRYFAAWGHKEFILCLGYKGEVIKEYFLNYYAFTNDITVDLASGNTTIHDGNQANWKVHLVDTGLHTQTGGRLRRLREWLDDGEVFHFTYGDGVADIDLDRLVDFHRSHGKLATVTAVRFPSRFGRLALDGSRVAHFNEKPDRAEGWISGGYFVLHTDVIDYIGGDDTIWERDPVEGLVADGQMMGYHHEGFWSGMDTLREKRMLEALWSEGNAPWRVWGPEGASGHR